eukprot:CAMPEP_0205825756 /NCGR_PEP_ID=MMETSP0206-20130828/26429_1 /ASSEMBLY_ACC=CAM_ASM_000279 /TAXON_ID=36767 /ORGANISM="Euplotes focardii, Strain TN1" /LENGTH=390 /DNA_ID=CAMNT_0053125081 /DNA_START=97 /DNA_END=1267 /DNA_ORIENTATION=-
MSSGATTAPTSKVQPQAQGSRAPAAQQGGLRGEGQPPQARGVSREGLLRILRLLQEEVLEQEHVRDARDVEEAPGDAGAAGAVGGGDGRGGAADACGGGREGGGGGAAGAGPEALKKAPVEPEKTDDELVALKLANARHFGEEDCLFCTHKAASLEASLQHMGAAHGFLVPDLEYLHDLRGLVEYLGQKIGIGNVCLYCDKMFNSAEAVMAHMVSLRHSKIRYDDDTEELEQFYDFSATWEGVAEDLGPGATPGKQEAAEVDERALMLATGKGVVEVVDGGYGLRLANGKIVGHRALVYLYRQRYRPPVERDGRVRAVIRNYRAIGWHTQHTKQSEKIRARALRNEKRWQLGVGVKANKLQPPLPQAGLLLGPPPSRVQACAKARCCAGQ